MIFIIFLILFIASLIGMFATLGIWTYYDAREKGLNAGLWTLIVLLGQNFIGLILYFLIGRKEEKTTCPSCNTKVLKISRFCNYCGEKIVYNPTVKSYKTKKFLVSFLISGILFIGSAIGFILSLAYDNNLPIWNHVSIGMTTSNMGDKWNV